MQAEADSQQIKLLAAELYEFQGRYPEVIKLYREVLESDKANPFQKVISRNNLAFTLAITKKDLGQAMELTQGAIRQFGPTSDLLDTRALVYLAQGNVKPAIADMQTALADHPSAAKYLHLAEAEKQAQNMESARAAMAKAQGLGVDLNRLSWVERKNYPQLVDQLK